MGKSLPAGPQLVWINLETGVKDLSAGVSKERKSQAEVKLPQLMNCLGYRYVLLQSHNFKMIMPGQVLLSVFFGLGTAGSMPCDKELSVKE